ncbi:hypothetical protein GCM10009836_21470 [Pseudonocardia ailaonensis]|uniref:Uncharacterized protein n=1 Tax=Pseudonocardia ailaonensis TaxID=367279 RepID=A0ABN2MWR3_9PSEU
MKSRVRTPFTVASEVKFMIVASRECLGALPATSVAGPCGEREHPVRYCGHGTHLLASITDGCDGSGPAAVVQGVYAGLP